MTSYAYHQFFSVSSRVYVFVKHFISLLATERFIVKCFLGQRRFFKKHTETKNEKSMSQSQSYFGSQQQNKNQHFKVFARIIWAAMTSSKSHPQSN